MQEQEVEVMKKKKEGERKVGSVPGGSSCDQVACC